MSFGNGHYTHLNRQTFRHHRSFRQNRDVWKGRYRRHRSTGAHPRIPGKDTTDIFGGTFTSANRDSYNTWNIYCMPPSPAPRNYCLSTRQYACTFRQRYQTRSRPYFNRYRRLSQDTQYRSPNFTPIEHTYSQNPYESMMTYTPAPIRPPCPITTILLSHSSSFAPRSMPVPDLPIYPPLPPDLTNWMGMGNLSGSSYPTQLPSWPWN